MQAYKLETTITNDGKIILPVNFKNIYSHKVEILVLDKENYNREKFIDVPAYSCGGKLADFTREDIYEPRI